MLFFYKKCGSKRITGTSRNVQRSNTKLRNLIRSVADSIRYKSQNSYTANFYPMKTTGTGSLQVFPALSMEQGCKNHRETLSMYVVGKPCNIYRLQGNPMMIIEFSRNL